MGHDLLWLPPHLCHFLWDIDAVMMTWQTLFFVLIQMYECKPSDWSYNLTVVCFSRRSRWLPLDVTDAPVAKMKREDEGRQAERYFADPNLNTHTSYFYIHTSHVQRNCATFYCACVWQTCLTAEAGHSENVKHFLFFQKNLLYVITLFTLCKITLAQELMSNLHVEPW